MSRPSLMFLNRLVVQCMSESERITKLYLHIHFMVIRATTLELEQFSCLQKSCESLFTTRNDKTIASVIGKKLLMTTSLRSGTSKS